ncbi:hypothetical protein [Plantactinospora sp. CA-290183]|uniref:hypothetical protein n=1 Tax=Plantactinospora sp. CA-290183 TaxID=3240006 RepID=UPI003D8BD427
MTAVHLRGAIVMTNGEIVRLRRQMQRRIRAVVAERRMARQGMSPWDDDGEQGPDGTEPHGHHTGM